MTDPLAPQPRPAKTQAEALARFTELAALDGPQIDPVCASVLDVAEDADHVFVFFHGFTNCPAQMTGLARTARALGATTFSPRAPGHGRADHDLAELGELTAEQIARFVDSSIDVAAGLAGRVTVVGFSFGGVCAAWAAANRDEVAEVLLIAPSFLPFGFPIWAGRFIGQLTALLPERYLWWDPVRKHESGSASYAYDRLSRRGIGAVFALGQDAWHHPPRRRTRLERAVLALNATDVAISAPAATSAFRRALLRISDASSVHRFPASSRYLHDLVDPQGLMAARAPEVWPQLIRLTTLGRSIQHEN